MGPRAKEFMKRYQERLAQATRPPEPPAPIAPPSSPIHDHETNHVHETRHDELIRRHTPPIDRALDLNIPGVDPLLVERLRERVFRAAERETRRQVREQEREERAARRRQQEEEARRRDTTTTFATGRKVEID